MTNIKFYIAGAKSLALAKFNTMINGKPDDEVIEFRVSQCKSCPLFKDNVCDPNRLVAKSGLEISLSEGERLPHIKDSFGILRAAVKDNEVYYRGCGCPIISNGKPNKPSYYFDENELEKRDGTGPCPMGKWSKEEFVKYIEKKYGASDNTNTSTITAD